MSLSGKRVLIAGAGISGLACARTLHQAGVQPLLLERNNAIGGRVQTDVVDGFLLDRGFQVFLSAYPQTRSLLDSSQLQLCRFKPGALVFLKGRLHRVMDVFREPRHFFSSALSPVGSLPDKLRVALLKFWLQQASPEQIAAHPDTTTEDFLRRIGFSAPMIDGFFRAFYGGIFLESDLRTSRRMFEFTFKMFSEGYATLPAGGMGEIPRHLASALPPGSIRLNQAVTQIRAKEVVLESGETLTADAVVLATNATRARALMPGLAGPEPRWRSVTCLSYAAPQSPLNEPIIALNGDGSGLVNNVCVPSDVSPSYAPKGQALISVSVLGLPSSDSLEHDVVAELEGWFGPQVRQWRHLQTLRIPRALPEQPPGSGLTGSGYQRHEGVYVCGDHLWSASIEGAVVSGQKTARAVLEHLHPEAQASIP
jgi:phytoene dehydrogenase-like protein